MKELEEKIAELEKSNKYLQSRIEYYEGDGVGKLYFSLQRKASEMADLLNKTRLIDIDIDDKNSKSFERLRTIWSDAENIATAINALGILSGLGNPESREGQPAKPEPQKSRVPLSSESIADAIGETAGKKKD